MSFDVTKEYDCEEFKRFVRDFLPEDFEPAYEQIHGDYKNVESGLRLGRCDSLNVDVFEFRSKKTVESRVALTHEACEVMKKYSAAPNALVAFHSEKSKIWRFSLITTDYLVEKGKVKAKYSNPRRFSFLLGEGCKRHTPESMLVAKGAVKSFEDLKSRFDIEVVTKEFYNALFSWYEWATSGDSGVYFPNNTETDADDREDIETKMIRLVTRIMFVWFIKQKDLVPGSLFDKDFLKTVLKDFDPDSADSGNYYNAILQNLFFATLNRAIVDEDGDRRGFASLKRSRDVKTLYRYEELFRISKEKVVELFSKVPFLNGGLFECLDKSKKIDGVDVAYNYDGFSRNAAKFKNGHFKHRAFIPNRLFFDEERGLLPLFELYNFTVEENTPSDVLVALDPELLGKVFENLLGTYNPETSETARKDSGSFYTPREIVNFMVDESLGRYLDDAVGVGVSDKVRRVMASEDAGALSDAERKMIREALKNVRVLDPACGSGAFPMGILNRIVDVFKLLGARESVYELKLHVIENCIYGSDIQRIAVQITKLRFFISLVCDCEKDEAKENFGIPTLPNLETKFVAADTLVAKKKRKRIENVEENDLFENPEIEKTNGELQKVRHDHFLAKSAAEKKALRERDRLLRKKLATLLRESDFTHADAKQLAEWDPYDQNAVSNFFDASWMFGVGSSHSERSEESGFDIVIGNPPYVQLQKNGGELAKKYEGENYKSFAKTGDIYCLFYERGFNLLKKGGHLCFITSNKWMRAGYGEKLREFLSKNTNPQLLIDFAGVKIFESATVDTNILLFEKRSRHSEQALRSERSEESLTTACVTKNLTENGLQNLSDFVQQNAVKTRFDTSESWVVLSPIEQSIKQKIEKAGIPLKDWDIQINYGIKTGYNDAFIITTEKRNEILSNCKSADEKKRTEELIRPILRGRDIKRYGYDWAGLWLIATFPSRHYDIEKYPAVKKFLLSFGMERLEQTGKEHIVNGEKIKARKKTNNKWFETQDSISYWEDFGKPKIVWGEISDKSKFAFDFDGEFIPEATTFYMIGEKIEFLLSALNSSISEWFFSKIGTTTGVGTVRWKKYTIEQLLVIKPSKDVLKEHLKKVKEFKSGKIKSKEFEKYSNDLMYHLYGLSVEEIAFIEKQ